MDKFINFAILRNPWNWFSIGAMIIIILASAFVVYSHLHSSPDGETPVNRAKES